MTIDFLAPRVLHTISRSSNVLFGAYVLNEVARAELTGLGFTLPIEIDTDLFFH